jgi:ABC-type amino acid transport system permease subunit
MTAARLRTVFWVDAVYSAVAGLLFLAGTWDGLYNALDLPQRAPAIFVQVGGAVLWGVAYLLWLATRTPALTLPLARASAIMNGVSAAVVIVWLINGLPPDVGTLGKIELAVAAAVMAVFTALYVAAGLRPGGYGPEPPPPPQG